MSDEQGLYYEISLTSRQVLVGILLLLACVMVAFLSGVWIAREATPEMPILAEGADAAPREDGVDFFDPEEAAAPPSEEQATGDQGGGEAGKEVARKQSREPAAPPEEPKLSRVVPFGSPAESEATPPAATVASEGTNGPVVIQVFSSHDEQQAKAILERLRSGGVRAFISPNAVDGKTMHRVRVGPFSDRTLAEAEAVMLRREYRLDTWITDHEG